MTIKRKHLLYALIAFCFLNLSLLAVADFDEIVIRLALVGFGLVGGVAFAILSEKP